MERENLGDVCNLDDACEALSRATGILDGASAAMASAARTGEEWTAARIGGAFLLASEARALSMLAVSASDAIISSLPSLVT